ncbi:uncharacterized protein LOC107771449 [Nicotiana tabacum]|uniref:Uncharacterized protein LOC107771449 n=1 Tax=Nicotiana tabacum TaxID=4097 RepID=A0AC58TL94_TOBAC
MILKNYIDSKHKKRDITENRNDYKEIYKGMVFKDIPESRKFMKLYALANKKVLKLGKSDPRRVRYRCIVGCPFVCLISKDGNAGVTIKTLESEHICGTAYDNSNVDFNTIAHYFKRKLQDNLKYKVREMVLDLKRIFELNVSHGKCKRTKRIILETLDGSFTDEYNKLDAYTIELRESNPGSDVMINISNNALENGKRRFLRMYVCFKAMKMSFKLGLRPFIGVDGTFLKGKANGQIASCFVDKETKHSWNWFLQLLQGSLDLKEGEGITFMSKMQKGLIEAIKTVLPQAHHAELIEHDENVVVRPMVISEVKTRLQPRQQVNLPAGTRSINFTGDHTSVSEPTDLSYSPAGLMWKGKAATTQIS